MNKSREKEARNKDRSRRTCRVKQKKRNRKQMRKEIKEGFALLPTMHCRTANEICWYEILNLSLKQLYLIPENRVKFCVH
jgi:hypothetical protein